MILKDLIKSAVLVLLFSCISFSYNDTTVIAIIGTHKIYTYEFLNRYSNYILSTGVKDNIIARKQILNTIIGEYALTYYDDNSSIIKNFEYKKELEWFKKQTVLAYLKDQEVYAKIKISDEELRTAFTRVNEKLAARHLYARTKEEADYLYNRVKNGEDFNKLAKEVFTDTSLSNNGGYLGFFTWGDMDPNFEDAVYGLKIGDISNPIKTAYGYSIIKLEERAANPILTETDFYKKRSTLERTLKLRKKKPAEQEYVNSLFNYNNIEFNENALPGLGKNFVLNKNNSESKIFAKPKSNKKIAEYNGKLYTESEIINKINEMPLELRERVTPDITDIKSAIAGIILNDILYNEAVKKGYDKSNEVKEAYENSNAQVFFNLKTREIVKKYVLPDSLIINQYKEFGYNYHTPNMVDVQEIIVYSKVIADSIISLLKNGEDFALLAKKYSQNKNTAKLGGRTGFLNVDNFGIFKDQIFKTNTNSLIGPIRTEDEFAIIKLLAKKEGSQIPFSDIKETIIKDLKYQHQTSIVEEYIKKLLKKISVQINTDVLASIEVK